MTCNSMSADIMHNLLRTDIYYHAFSLTSVICFELYGRSRQLLTDLQSDISTKALTCTTVSNINLNLFLTGKYPESGKSLERFCGKKDMIGNKSRILSVGKWMLFPAAKSFALNDMGCLEGCNISSATNFPDCPDSPLIKGSTTVSW